MNASDHRTAEFDDSISSHYEAQSAEFARELEDFDACVELWRTVIERALADLEYLHRFDSRQKLKKHELEKLRRIQESPPDDFIEGHWFEQICDYLQIDADRVRNGLDAWLRRAA